MKLLSMFAAPVLFLSPTLFAQQPGPQSPPPPQARGQRPYTNERPAADREQERVEREEMYDERQDLGELGLPQGAFWLDTDLASRIHLTSDQVHRLSDTYLQGRLKIIQLEANEQMEEAKLDAYEGSPTMDSNEAMSTTDRLADDRAATEKADAHLAFALRAILTPDQLSMLKNGYMHAHMDVARRQPRRPAANASGSAPAAQRQQPPA